VPWCTWLGEVPLDKGLRAARGCAILASIKSDQQQGSACLHSGALQRSAPTARILTRQGVHGPNTPQCWPALVRHGADKNDDNGKVAAALLTSRRPATIVTKRLPDRMRVSPFVLPVRCRGPSDLVRWTASRHRVVGGYRRPEDVTRLQPSKGTALTFLPNSLDFGRLPSFRSHFGCW